MKNIIFIILIAIFFFSSIEQESEQSLSEMWESVKNDPEKAINWLKDMGYYDFLVNLLKIYDKEIATNICIKKIADGALCEAFITFLLELIR